MIEHIISIIYHFLWPGFMVTNYLVAIDLLNFMGAKIAWNLSGKNFEHQLNVVHNSLQLMKRFGAVFPREANPD